MGEAVNIAFRLESGTKESGCDILIAQEVFRSLSDVRFSPAPMIDVDLKGYSQPSVAYPLDFNGTGPFIEALLSA